MRIQPNATLRSWLAKRDPVAESYEVDDEQFQWLLEECYRAHPEYEHNECEAWAAYSLICRNVPPAAKRDWPRIGEWLWRAAVLLLLALIAVGRASAQGTSQIDIIQFLDGSNTILGTYASPFKIKCSTGTTCTAGAASTLTLTASGTGGTLTNFSANGLTGLFGVNVANPTTTPALTFSYTHQAANFIFAGPTTGGDSDPTFRLLVAADLPTHNAATATALAANGANCSGNNFALGVDASGVGECAQPAFSNLSGAASDAQVDGSSEADELVLVGDVDGAANVNDIDESAVESELETVLDLDQLQGQVSDLQIADGAVDGGTGGEIADSSVNADDLGVDAVSSSELNATGVESELEGVLDLQDLQGAVIDGQVPNTITIDLAADATSLAANGANCTAGNYPLGVDEFGAVEDCTAVGAGAGDIEGVTAGAGIGGGGTSGTVTVTTASGEADFLASGALACGAATQGKMQVHTTPLQYCDNAATPGLQYAAYGDNTGAATLAPSEAYDAAGWNADTAPAERDDVRDQIEAEPAATRTLTNKTLAAADNVVEADTGDTATAFFSAGAIEAARGGNGAAPTGDDYVPVSDSTSAITFRQLPNCTDTGGNHLNYTQSSNTWSCGTSGDGGGTAMGQMVATAFVSKTFTNIGTSYADVYVTAFDQENLAVIDFTGFTACRAVYMWDYVGSGTQQVRWADAADNNNVLIEAATFTADRDATDTGWVSLPAAFSAATKTIEWQGKSTTAGDDPVAKGYALFCR